MRGRSWIVGLVALGAACSSTGKSSSETTPLIETTVASSADTRTGEPIGEPQQWSPNEYYLGCCGDESHWVLRSGGVVIARVDDVIEVWYPAGVAPPTRTVPIP